jgi:hypothetical protein
MPIYTNTSSYIDLNNDSKKRSGARGIVLAAAIGRSEILTAFNAGEPQARYRKEMAR